MIIYAYCWDEINSLETWIKYGMRYEKKKIWEGLNDTLHTRDMYILKVMLEKV